MDPLSVERIAMEQGKMSLLVRVNDGFPRMTDGVLGRYLLAARPTLAHHTCVNGIDPSFGAVAENTSLPHVLEHVIIDEQAHNDSGDSSKNSTKFVGTTEWVDKEHGRARVEVSFTDDLVALRALKSALAFVNNMVLSCKVTSPDIGDNSNSGHDLS